MDRKQASSSGYRLGKNKLQQTPISATYSIFISESQQKGKCKVFDLQKIEEKDMLSVLEYNQEVLTLMDNKYQNSLLLSRIFSKKGKEFIAVEDWDQRLSAYINETEDGLSDQVEVKRILQEVLMSICNIYNQNYMILNLRPQHIVRVANPSQGSLGWKIQSFVYSASTHGLPDKCEYQFDYEWASNEEKLEKQNLNQNLRDEQIVWYMGILALRMIIGKKFRLKWKFEDTDINYNELKKVCLPEVFGLIQKSVKANYKSRISLKQFLDLSVFSEVEIMPDAKNKFIAGSQARIKNSMMKNEIFENSIIHRNSQILKNSLSSILQLPEKSKFQMKKAAGSTTQKQAGLSQAKSQKIFNELRWMLEKCVYLAEIKYYTQAAASINRISVEDKTVIRYLFFKIAQTNLKLFKIMIESHPIYREFRQSQNHLYKNLVDLIQQNDQNEKKGIINQAFELNNKMKKLQLTNLKMLQPFKDIIFKFKSSVQNSNVDIKECTYCFSIVVGKFYSQLKKHLQNSKQIENKAIKIRILCYFILCSYIVLVNLQANENQNQVTWLLENDFRIYKQKYFDEQIGRGSIKANFSDAVQQIRLCQFTENGGSILIQNCQLILKKYFKMVKHKRGSQNRLI